MHKEYEISAKIDAMHQKVTVDVGKQLASRGVRASQALKNASMEVLRGQRSGRRYRVPGTGAHYTASAPGEPPAVRTGAFRLGWRNRAYAETRGKTLVMHSIIENPTRTDNKKYLLGSILEQGTGRMAPRPYMDRIYKMAEDEIKRIYKEPYV